MSRSKTNYEFKVLVLVLVILIQLYWSDQREKQLETTVEKSIAIQNRLAIANMENQQLKIAMEELGLEEQCDCDLCLKRQETCEDKEESDERYR